MEWVQHGGDRLRQIELFLYVQSRARQLVNRSAKISANLSQKAKAVVSNYFFAPALALA